MFTEYLLYFMVYSFLGWLYESLYYSLQFKKLINTGFLRGCFCPIYGLACVSNLFILGGANSDAAVFLVSMLVISSIEYIVSWFFEKRFGKRWWDYSGLPFNINGRISLFSSLAFGIMSVVQLRVIHPVVVHLILCINPRAVKFLMMVSLFVLFVDLVYSVYETKHSDSDRLWFVDEMSPVMQNATDKFNCKRHSISDKCAEIYANIRDWF